MRSTTNWTALLLCAVLQPAMAGDADSGLLAQLRKAHPATRFDRVARTPIPGLYEVWMGENVAFVARGNLRYMVFGHLVDVHSMRDLTAQRRREGPQAGPSAAIDGKAVDPADIKALPLDNAIPLVLGTGVRHLVVFTDPGCGYCRQLDKSLRGLRDVTVHHFLLPFLGSALPEAILCAPDRAAAYARAMVEGAMPGGAPSGCASPLQRNLALASRLGVRATPTLLFADGRRIAGAVSGDEIEARLAGAAAANSLGTGSGKE